jgi:hypothetical protein
MSGRPRSKRGSMSTEHSPYSRTRRWPRATETMGGKTVAAKLWARARQRWPLSEGGRRGRPMVQTRRLTLGAHAVSLLSPNYPNQLKVGN